MDNQKEKNMDNQEITKQEITKQEIRNLRPYILSLAGILMVTGLTLMLFAVC